MRYLVEAACQACLSDLGRPRARTAMEDDPLFVLIGGQACGFELRHWRQQSAFDALQHEFLRRADIDQNDFTVIEPGFDLLGRPVFQFGAAHSVILRSGWRECGNIDGHRFLRAGVARRED